MKTKNWLQKKIELFKDDFDFRFESLLLVITEQISKRLEKKSISRTKFAELLNISSPAVTKLLNGNNNFTLKTLLSISDAIDCNLKIEFEEKNAAISRFSIKTPFGGLLTFENEFEVPVSGYIVPIKSYSSTNIEETTELAA